MRRIPQRLRPEKTGVPRLSREKELEEWAKAVRDAAMERECAAPAKFTARAASNEIAAARTTRICLFNGILSPLPAF